MHIYCVLVLFIPCIPADAIMTNSTNPSNRTMSMVEAFHDTVHTVQSCPAGDLLDVSSGTSLEPTFPRACPDEHMHRVLYYESVCRESHWQG